MKIRTGIAMAVVATAIAGCGSTKIVTHTDTVLKPEVSTQVQTVQAQARVRTVVQVRTVTVTTAAASSSPGGSSGSTASNYQDQYPASFEDSFVNSCQQDGGDSGGCSCALKYIEDHEPYETVVAAEHDIALGEDPSWYTAAADSCAGE